MSNIHVNIFSKYYSQIKKLYEENKTAKEIIEIINDPLLTNPNQIYKIASNQGFSKNNNTSKCIKNKFEQIDKKAIELIKSGLSCTKTANLLNIDQQSMNKRLKQYYNFSVLPDGKKKVNSNFFDEINTEEKAYWLGFMYADGYVSKNTDAIELALCENDYAHVLKFKKSLNANHTISEKYATLNGKVFKAYRLSIRDKQLKESLQKHGCVPNKSLILTFPKIEKDLIRHFIRGYFDGDGSISINHFSVSIVSGSRYFLQNISKILLELNIKSSYREKAERNLFEIRFFGDNARNFLRYIYDNSNFYLDRKYEKYCKILPSKEN